MDVTSMLNSSSVASGDERATARPTERVEGMTGSPSASADASYQKAVPRAAGDMKPPSRNRTPWDGDGYSLPPALDTRPAQAPARPTSHSMSPPDSNSPKSPRHKPSDSDSSINSYESSTLSPSHAHSRDSSTSTNGGSQPVSTLPDAPRETKFDGSDVAMPKIRPSDTHERRNIGIAYPLTTWNPPRTGTMRPGSPSDAVLISRGAPRPNQTNYPDTIIQTPESTEISCRYQAKCDTGSQLRKAISHIFGRNKTCTRSIPSHVWVYFCRKHYQRSRYRNAHEWAKVQCDLVQEQIRRVQKWSDDNKRTGQPGVVQDWSLSMRKREQNRVQEKSNRKRPHPGDSDDEDDDMQDSAMLNGTAVPEWLRSKCGSGYSTAEIEEIVARLKQEMEETGMTQIPDIEILPNIPTEASGPSGAKAPLKRRTNGGGGVHRRSQSVGVSLLPESQPMARRVSQPPYWQQEYDILPPPTEKRQRTSDAPPYNNLYGLSGRPTLAPPRQVHNLTHRPGFNNMQESRVQESYYSNGEEAGNPGHGYGRDSNMRESRARESYYSSSEEARNPGHGYGYWPLSNPQRNPSQQPAAGRGSNMQESRARESYYINGEEARDPSYGYDHWSTSNPLRNPSQQLATRRRGLT
ncbi:hypothetical protein GGS23DRAFT_607102 [Durotheca rogersii]|uniref:uncharacterized protein n=1 Tax=Durotheca rogersii TaxID=419775 RepID=UPI002220C67F|nr:uncharacterized protein GGS23DRAFT_607102 [Durotheca rogersii]KAI5860126.1 hypothetical protein GGS23DRAFT_607102 [Durotheca rogersii]